MELSQMLGDILMFRIRDVASGPREFNISLLCSFHTDVRTTMIYTRTLNRDGKGVPGSLSDIDLFTVANDPRPSASFSARKNPPYIPANTLPVFPDLRPHIWPHLLRLATNGVGQAPTQPMRWFKG
jgi:hypothetical protein